MTAYMIMDVDVLDPPQYETYKREVPKLVEKHGSEYLVRGRLRHKGDNREYPESGFSTELSRITYC